MHGDRKLVILNERKGTGWPEPEVGHAMVEIFAIPLSARPVMGLGVQTDPPPFLFHDQEALDETTIRDILRRAERRLKLLQPSLARIFCFPELWNPSLDGRTFDWDHPHVRRLVRMLTVLREIRCQVNLVMFSLFDRPLPIIEHGMEAMLGLLDWLRNNKKFDNIRWLTIFNEPETVFRHDSPLSREVLGERAHGIPHTWDEYVSLNRRVIRRLKENGLSDIQIVAPDSAWGAGMRRERMELAFRAFSSEDICYSYHHYNPEEMEFYENVPAPFRYAGMREEASRFRHLLGESRPLIIWEFNNAGKGFSAHVPGLDAYGRSVLDVPEAGAKLSARVLRALRYGVDGLCLWHMHDSDVNKFGLWRWRDKGYTVKPVWHYYALLCRAVRGGLFVLSGTESPSGLDVLGLGGGSREENFRVLVLNDGPEKRRLELRLPRSGCWCRSGVWPEMIPPAEEEIPLSVRIRCVGDGEGRLRITLNPWELTLLEYCP